MAEVMQIWRRAPPPLSAQPGDPTPQSGDGGNVAEIGVGFCCSSYN